MNFIMNGFFTLSYFLSFSISPPVFADTFPGYEESTTTAELSLVSSKTTSSPANNTCPKTYLFTLTYKATSSGQYKYQFIQSDGGRGPLEIRSIATGQLVTFQYTWELIQSVQNAWVGISFNGGAPQDTSTFTFTCPQH